MASKHFDSFQLMNNESFFGNKKLNNDIFGKKSFSSCGNIPIKGIFNYSHNC